MLTDHSQKEEEQDPSPSCSTLAGTRVSFWSTFYTINRFPIMDFAQAQVDLTLCFEEKSGETRLRLF